MTKDLVSLNVNPCKMCMPMGSATAMYGIRGCMTILHGSQGCSTYIRRHMATHYNEPVDIASSSLTEQGTVMGGEKNLKKGLDNVILLYDPEVIGVATTCLAETIGEDIPRILEDYRAEHPDIRTELIPISSAGYSGTQFEGYFKALRSVVENVDMDISPNDLVNIVAGPLSPADVRYLKGLMDSSGVDYVLLPDISDNLDGGHEDIYHRLPQKGTSIDDIRKMGGAKLTMEISSFVPDRLSPAVYLKERFGVPFVRLNLPIGLRDNDMLVSVIESAGGNIDGSVREQRSRYLDAMVDSHKHNAGGRAAVFGEPDFVYAVVRMMTENGIAPKVIATGSVSENFKDVLRAELGSAISECDIMDDADFDMIERRVLERGVNVMVGSSEARRIAERDGIPLIRSAFPIHDHIGGQRVRTIGYEGSLTFIDRITNSLIDGIETTFRGELHDRYFLWDKNGNVIRGEEDVQCWSVRPETVRPSADRTILIAVSSKSGVLVDQHFGHTDDFYIYECSGEHDIRFREHRSVSKYSDGSACCGGSGIRKSVKGQNKIERILGVIGDCRAVVSMRIGDAPSKRLDDLGILNFVTGGRIEDAVKTVVRDITGKE